MDFDFGEIKIPAVAQGAVIPNYVEKKIAEDEKLEHHHENVEQIKISAQVSAEKVEELTTIVSTLQAELTKERAEREKADEENKKESEKERKRNLTFNIFSSIIGGLGFILALAQFIASLIS